MKNYYLFTIIMLVLMVSFFTACSTKNDNSTATIITPNNPVIMVKKQSVKYPQQGSVGTQLPPASQKFKH